MNCRKPGHSSRRMTPAEGTVRAGLFALSLLAAGPATAQGRPQPDPPATESCKLSLNLSSGVYYRGPRSRGYEPFETLRHQERFQVGVEHRGGRCNYVLATTTLSGGAMRSGSGELRYELKEDGGGRDLLSQAFGGDSGTQVRGAFSGGKGADVIHLYLEAPPGQAAPAGEYEDLVIFRVFDDEDGQLHLKDERALRVSTTVGAVVEAAIGADPGSGLRETSVNLGTLSTGLRRPLLFSSRSNTPVDVAFSSANGGQLRHSRSTASVPYGIRISGQRLEVGSAPQVFTPLISQAGQASQHTFEVEVDEVPFGAPAGAYSDRLTLTITAK